MKRHTIIVAIHTKHSDLEISQFFSVVQSFVDKVRRDLEASDGNVESVAKCRKHKPRSDTVRALQFVQKVQYIIDEDHSKSIRAILRDLQASECTIRRIVHEDIRYKSFVMRRGQFTSVHDNERLDVRESA